MSAAPGAAQSSTDPREPAAQRELRKLAEAAARLGGAVARSYFRRDLPIRLKPDHSEVSEADDAAQAAIVQQIRALRPADAFLTEETLAVPEGNAPPPPEDGRVCWVIDPIDGTRNFVRGIPLYACSVGAMFGGVPVVGAIYEPQRDVLYSASQAEGFFVDSAPAGPAHIPAAGGVKLKMMAGIPSQPARPVRPLVHDWLDRFVCRNLGSTALHMALVATGELDAMIADNSRLWDIAAGYVPIAATGGIITSPAGKPVFPLDVAAYHGEKLPITAARAELHAALIPRGRRE